MLVKILHCGSPGSSIPLCCPLSAVHPTIQPIAPMEHSPLPPSMEHSPLPAGLAMALGIQPVAALGTARSSQEALPEVLPEAPADVLQEVPQEETADTEGHPQVEAEDTEHGEETPLANFERLLDGFISQSSYPYGWRQPSHGYLAYPIMRPEDVNGQKFRRMLDSILVLAGPHAEVRWSTPADAGTQNFQAMVHCPILGNITFGITNGKQKSKAECMRGVRDRVYIMGATKICPVQKRILVALKLEVYASFAQSQ